MEALDACQRLKFVQLMSAGFDTFYIWALQARGVRFVNGSAAIAPAVAEHTITAMLARSTGSWKAGLVCSTGIGVPMSIRNGSPS